MAFAVGLLSPLRAQTQQSWQSESVFLESTPGPLSGTLVLPAVTKPVPLAIIIAGSGPTDRNGNSAGLATGPESYRLLAEQLAARGIASLRYDKRGIAASRAAGGPEREIRFDALANDAAAWVRLFRADPRFTSIIVVGHSEGSLLGMLAVERSAVDGFISIAGPARRANVVLLEQLAAQLPPLLMAQADSALASLALGDTVANTPPLLASLLRPSVQPYLISWFRYTGAEEIARLTIPVLIVQGTHDMQVQVAEADLLAKAQPAARLAIIDGMNHVLKLTPAPRAEQMASYSDPSLPVAPQLVSAITDFILGTSRIKR